MVSTKYNETTELNNEINIGIKLLAKLILDI